MPTLNAESGASKQVLRSRRDEATRPKLATRKNSAGASTAAAQFRSAVPTLQITPEEVQARLSFRLRQIIGPGRRFNLSDAAQLTGINERTLKAYVDGSACPNLARYGKLLRVFGPEVGIELAMMLGWEPRASNAKLPQTDDLRAMREAMAQVVRAIDLVQAASREHSPTPS